MPLISRSAIIESGERLVASIASRIGFFIKKLKLASDGLYCVEDRKHGVNFVIKWNAASSPKLLQNSVRFEKQKLTSFL